MAMAAMAITAMMTATSKHGKTASDQRGECGIVSITWHARKRGARRNVAPDAVEYVLAYGRVLQRTGVTFFFLGRRDIPACDRCASWASRLEGTILIVAPDGDVITVYRNRKGWRAIARKMKYRLSSRSQRWADTDDAQPLAADRATA